MRAQASLIGRGPTSVPWAAAAVRPVGWAEAYRQRLTLTDVLSVIGAVSAAQILRFGVDSDATLANLSFISYSLVSVLLSGAWILVLSMFRAREARIVGSGAEEYRRVAHASFALFGTVAVVAYLLRIEVARGYLLVALPSGLLLLLVSRWVWRRWLARQRAARRYLVNVLVVGSHRSAVEMAKTFERDPRVGYRVVGVCEPGSTGDRTVDVHGHRVRVLGDESAVMQAIEETGATMVAVSNTDVLGTEGMRALAWRLEATDTDLVVSPGVVDVAGPRLQVRPVAGLPLLHVEKPQYRGANTFGKLAVDVLGAAAALLVLAPFMLLVAALVRVTSPGPAFYRSERIGLNEKPFAMLKFRSMSADADQRRLGLVGEDEGSGPLFKLRQDPRVTPLGRVLRRFSIDELPQLFNVLRGHMSIVGPRPPLRAEVMTYDDVIHRRLLVKPGITGLWQVSGRSDLSWEESVRLDLYYVENWSFLQDLIIIWRTVKAVFSSSGAY